MPEPLLPDALYLLTNSVALPALDATFGGTRTAKWVAALQSYFNAHGKFSKFSVAYVPVQPPPLFWDYNCGRCRFWIEPESTQRLGRCTLVDGPIARGGWCAIWIPPDNVKPFTWLPRVLQDAPNWLQEAPEAFLKWVDSPLPPKELWMLGGG